MKNTFFVSLVLLLTAVISACTSNNKNDAVTTPTSKSVSSETITGSDSLASALDGIWVSEIYLSKIDKSKSIFKNHEVEDSMLGFSLYEDTLKSKQPRLLGFSVHEGGLDAPLKYNSQKKQFENDLDLVEEFSVFKTPFSIKLGNPDQIEIAFSSPDKREKYRRTTNLDTELRKILFEGKYTDQLSNTKIIFHQNGEIEGIANKNFYSLVFDFEEFQFDVVSIADNDKRENQHEYHYKIEGNTLKLFALEGNDETGYTIGRLAYNLEKI